MAKTTAFFLAENDHYCNIKHTIYVQCARKSNYSFDNNSQGITSTQKL